MTQTISDAANQRAFQNAATNCQPYIGTPYPQRPAPSMLEQLGVDPTSKLAKAIEDHAAAIRELADVLYHIGTED